MNKKTKISLVLGLILLVGSLIWIDTQANITADHPAIAERYETYTFFTSVSRDTFNTFAATTTNATSTDINAFVATTTNYTVDNGYFVIAGAKKVTMFFQRGDTSGQGNTGTSTFRVQVSPDGTNWFNFNRLVTATSSTQVSAQTIGGNVTLSASSIPSTATSTAAASLDLTYDSFYAVRCIVVEQTDGEHSCKAAANW